MVSESLFQRDRFYTINARAGRERERERVKTVSGRGDKYVCVCLSSFYQRQLYHQLSRLPLDKQNKKKPTTVAELRNTARDPSSLCDVSLYFGRYALRL